MPTPPDPHEDAGDDRPAAPDVIPPPSVALARGADLVVGGPDGAPFVDPAEQTQTLKFHFTPRAALAGEMERLQTENPHAKASTVVPKVIQALQDRFGGEGGAVGEVVGYAGETTVYVDRDAIADVCLFLRDEVGFDYMADMATVDRFTEEDRFEVVYNLCALKARKRIRLKVRVDEDDPAVPTVTHVWPGAGWHEREAWDMMGIRFDGNPDMRRIYMPEDFEYHPLRKEFPTLGIPGSLPLPPNHPDGDLQLDPYPRAHGLIPKDLSTDEG
ncbi:NADH-quinone oxidoreductase subunit C [Rubrivirga sp. S365]|uniref:NADH-quinone oxidoreductase subunit C n=1 Tax=Rubrivirga litoralis TaxID=3075598 RepID=A0ABU3BM20_9BACT|nr:MULTISPECIES: NADH-quinone oxidoreductase subunit C [unclassified Rubrivirga]MDT0630344.1 NADH-quinone oxidoreductase subunit C [Rubrivirga sp. F394]MDT7855855.1 NADH-quinone oxidoreductase subunit C [Rubrivirga sp. S365]